MRINFRPSQTPKLDTVLLVLANVALLAGLLIAAYIKGWL